MEGQVRHKDKPEGRYEHSSAGSERADGYQLEQLQPKQN